MKFDASRQPLSIILMLSVGLLALFWHRTMVAPLAVEQTLSLGFGLGGLVDDLSYGGRWWADVVCGLAILLNATTIARIVSVNMVLSGRSFMTVLFYVIVGFGVYFGRNSLNELIASVLIVQGSFNFIAGFKRSLSLNTLFKAGLLFGLAPLFYPPSLVFLLIIPVGLVLFMRTAREGVVMFFGYFLPALILSYVYWAKGLGFLWFGKKCFQYFVESGGSTLFHSSMGIPRVALLAFLVLLIGFSMWAFVVHGRDSRTRPYTVFVYFIWLFVVSLLMFVLPCRSWATFMFVAIGSSVVMPYYFVKYTNIFAVLLYLFIVLAAVATNIP